MIVCDVNVLIAAHIASHPHHDRARPFLTRCLAEDTVLVPDLVWAGFLRLVTNPRIFESPTTQAVDFVRAVTTAPGYRPVAGLIDGLEPFLRLVEEAEVRADLVPDAYIAAVARAHDCAIATFDRDFRRFDGIRLIVPGS